MSKNMKCPVCQKGTIMFKENLSCECSQCRFQCHHGQIERIAAAMELAKATRTLEDAMEPLNSGNSKWAGAPSDSACHGRSKSVRTARLGGVQMNVKRYDFDCYAFYDSARLDVNECEDGDYVLHDDYAILLARHTALVEAVAWERECIRQLDCAGKFWEDDNIPGRELIKILDAARVEVDRLIAEPKHDLD